MSALTIADFDEFFREVTGHSPFSWQRRLCRFVVEHGRWPDGVHAPTGTGKSSVVYVHAFVNAIFGERAGLRVPRRLSIVVNRRAIVDSHFDAAQRLSEHLRLSHPDSVAGRVSTGLWKLRCSAPESDELRSPVVVVNLRGGMAADSTWIDDPSACAIICATPDMWGSRLLFGGYGTAKAARPREAGLLALDSVVVVDEAHLNRQLLATARRVASVCHAQRIGVPELQVVETTATPASEATQAGSWVGVDLIPDLADSDVLARRLTTPKPLTLSAREDWPGAKRPGRPYTTHIAELVEKQIAAVALNGGTVGCVVNSVETAQEVYSRLDRAYPGAVILWIGPMRALDLMRARKRHPGAFTVAGDQGIRAVVATQTVEVGVDVDFAAMVTELAPGSSLAQRVGRVNRLGTRDAGPVTVVVPVQEPQSRSGPYHEHDLAAAYSWLIEVAASSEGMAFSALDRIPPPVAGPVRSVVSRIEAGDVVALTSTSETQVADVELAMWLRDDLAADPARVGVVLRGPLPQDEGAALGLLRATPPVDEEVYPVTIAVAREVLAFVERARGFERRAFLLSDGEWSVADMDSSEVRTLRPGDVLVLDSAHAIARDGTLSVSGGQSESHTIWGEALRVFSSGNAEDAAILSAFARQVANQASNYVSTEEEILENAVALVKSFAPELDRRRVQVSWMESEDRLSGPIAWIVVSEDSSLVDNEEVRQAWSGRAAVTLDNHQTAVAERARALGESLGLDAVLIEVLRAAGEHHDDGKAHPEFQLLLGRAGDGPQLAKSGGSHAAMPAWRRRQLALRRGWRHEQLSAVMALKFFDGRPSDELELIVRLVGTSHGRGLSSFEAPARDVLAGEMLELEVYADELFSRGAWEELIDATDARWGSWGCAFLEAVLRSADCMVSKEGS